MNQVIGTRKSGLSTKYSEETNRWSEENAPTKRRRITMTAATSVKSNDIVAERSGRSSKASGS
jgi:hypothetical protein